MFLQLWVKFNISLLRVGQYLKSQFLNLMDQWLDFFPLRNFWQLHPHYYSSRTKVSFSDFYLYNSYPQKIKGWGSRSFQTIIVVWKFLTWIMHIFYCWTIYIFYYILWGIHEPNMWTIDLDKIGNCNLKD